MSIQLITIAIYSHFRSHYFGMWILKFLWHFIHCRKNEKTFQDLRKSLFFPLMHIIIFFLSLCRIYIHMWIYRIILIGCKGIMTFVYSLSTWSTFYYEISLSFCLLIKISQRKWKEINWNILAQFNEKKQVNWMASCSAEYT